MAWFTNRLSWVTTCRYMLPWFEPGQPFSFSFWTLNIQHGMSNVQGRKSLRSTFFIHPMDIPCWLLDIQSFGVAHKPPVLSNNLKIHVTLVWTKPLFPIIKGPRHCQLIEREFHGKCHCASNPLLLCIGEDSHKFPAENQLYFALGGVLYYHCGKWSKAKTEKGWAWSTLQVFPRQASNEHAKFIHT